MLDEASSALAEHAPAAPEVVRLQAEFHGSAGEYFRIWIVNLVLGVLTLGIYGAWAKVRNERYFYGNTRIDGSAFEYLAQPLQILKGRLIAYAVVIALVASQFFMPLLYLVLMLGIFVCVPLIVYMSLRFRARYSAWRGIRFGFTGTAGEAYGPFLGWQILTAITLSLLYPVARWRQHQYMVDNHRFGTEAFRFRALAGMYYPPYLLGLLGWVGAFVVLMVAMVAMAAGTHAAGLDEEQAARAAMATMLPAILLFYLAMFAVMAFVYTRYTNLLWNNTRLGEHRFECTLRARDMLWLYASNLVVMLCTLGLATPWAKVRLARYRADRFAVLASGGTGDFLAGVGGEQGATGMELGEALDAELFDIGF